MFNLRLLVFNQSSPVHPVSESSEGGGTLSLTAGRTMMNETFVSNIGLKCLLCRFGNITTTKNFTPYFRLETFKDNARLE